MIHLKDSATDPPLPLPRIERIGVFKFRNIGDVLMITPALRALRETFPQADITVAVNSVTDAMLLGNPHLNRVLVYDRLMQKRGPVRRAAYELKFFNEIRRSRFDLTVDFTSGDRPARYSLFSGARVRLAFRDWKGRGNWRNRAYTHTMADASMRIHEVERHLLLLRPFGITTSDRSLCLMVEPAAQTWATDLLKPLRPSRIIHVHPVARWLFKCWEDARVAAIIDWLELEKNVRTVITSSATEKEVTRTKNILALCRSQPLALPGETTLSQLAAISAASDGFFGVDTAPMHIAAAVGKPVVSLFGPTHRARWHPWCDRQVTLAKSCRCTDLARKECDWSGVRACLQSISVDEAKAAMNEIL